MLKIETLLKACVIHWDVHDNGKQILKKTARASRILHPLVRSGTTWLCAVHSILDKDCRKDKGKNQAKLSLKLVEN